MNRFVARYTVWVLLVSLGLSVLPGQLVLALLPSHHSSLPEQSQEGSEGALSETEEPSDTLLRPRRVSVTAPTWAWRVVREPSHRTPHLRMKPLVHEDLRHVLLPRRTAPPSEDPHA